MEKQTAGRNELGGFAPEFARLNDDVLFGEIWSREDRLPRKLRSIVTLSVFLGKGMIDGSLKYHLSEAKKNGVSRQEMAEILTHAAFYAGWPNAWAAFRLAKEVYAEDGEDQEMLPLFGKGELNAAFAAYFSGESFLNPIYGGKADVCNVTFAAGCRNHWHVHHGGVQVLLCTDGEGWYREWDKPARRLKAGDAIVVPAETKHWHGAAANSGFAHVSVSIPAGDAFPSCEWMEPVSDEEYENLE